MEPRRKKPIKAAIINRREYVDRDISITAWPAPTNDGWDAWRAEIMENNFDLIIFTPPGPFQLSLQQLKNFILFNEKPPTAESAVLPRLQDEFEAKLQNAANFTLIILTPEQLGALSGADFKQWSEITSIVRKLKPAFKLHAGINPWHAARLRGALMRQRLLGFNRQNKAQLKLEVNYLAQIFIMLSGFSLLVCHLLGPSNLAWLAVFLIYPLNRPFIRYVAEQAPEKTNTSLGYCLLRPLGWLAGMLCPPANSL